MESGLIFWGLATLAAVFVGLGKGGLPVVAALAVPSLALIMSPIAAAGLLLPVYIVSDVFALAAYRRDYNKQVLKIAVIAMSFGVLIGGLTAHLVIEWMVTALIGLMLEAEHRIETAEQLHNSAQQHAAPRPRHRRHSAPILCDSWRPVADTLPLQQFKNH